MARPREKAQAATTARLKVPMRRLGADCFVVVMKRGNARGAKGAAHRHLLGSTGVGSTDDGRNPMSNGRRQPSRGGTSRMTRECQVRICETLGVKFPGPTRQSHHIGTLSTLAACPPCLQYRPKYCVTTKRR